MTPDELFAAGGGYGFADQVADGMDKRITETIRGGSGQVSVGVIVNSIELAWLIEGYNRLRQRGDYEDAEDRCYEIHAVPSPSNPNPHCPHPWHKRCFHGPQCSGTGPECAAYELHES